MKSAALVLPSVIKTRDDLWRAMEHYPEVRGQRAEYYKGVRYYVGTSRVDESLLRELLREGALKSRWDGATPVLYRPEGTRLPPEPTASEAYARRTDPPTSHQAAGTQRNHTRKSQRVVLWALEKYGPGTHDEIIARVNACPVRHGRQPVRYSDQRLRSATAELVIARVVVAMGTKPTGRTAANGHPTHATIWTLRHQANARTDHEG